jgi:hypothetical protein
MLELVRYRDKRTQSGNGMLWYRTKIQDYGMLWYRTKIQDSGMPMPVVSAAVAAAPTVAAPVAAAPVVASTTDAAPALFCFY